MAVSTDCKARIGTKVQHDDGTASYTATRDQAESDKAKSEIVALEPIAFTLDAPHAKNVDAGDLVTVHVTKK